MSDGTLAIRQIDNARVLAAAFRLGQDILGTEPVGAGVITTDFAGHLRCESRDAGAGLTPGAAVAPSLLAAADQITWPAHWRRIRRTVELCQRAAEVSARR